MIALAVLTAAIAISSNVSNPIIDRAADIPASQEVFAACVSHRESRDNPRSTNNLSSAAGKWQFLQSKWGHGLPYMVANRLREFNMPHLQAKEIRIKLSSTPIHHWDEDLQDVAFLAVMNFEGAWSGWRHWYITGSRCNVLVGAR